MFYLYSKESEVANYCKEVVSGGKTQLAVNDAFAAWLNTNWNGIPAVCVNVGRCPLYTAQMEHLQVGLELFLKLAKVEFADDSLADAKERTGGSRFAKKIRFSTNMMIFADVVSAYSPAEINGFIEKWLAGTDDAAIAVRAKEVLLPFTEECQYKLRTSSGEIFFQQDGIYERLRNVGDTVQSSDSHEPVGPFRILKSYIKDGMHPFVEDSDSGFRIKSGRQEFIFYADKVKTTLSLIPKRTVVTQEIEACSDGGADGEPTFPPLDTPLQLIAYGAPGTGKSWKTDPRGR